MNPPTTCFIIMPFLPELKAVRDVVADVVQRQKNGTAFRADDSYHPGSVIEQVKHSIAMADFCVADVSGANPNVLWEAGYAHGLNKPVIQICQDTASMPFDIRAMRTLEYSLDDLTEASAAGKETALHTPLGEAVSAVVRSLVGKPRILGAPYDELRTLAESLQHRSIYTRRTEPVLGIVLRALNEECTKNPNRIWQTGDPARLMQSVAKVASRDAQDTFWWLIVHGVLVYDQIHVFQSYGSNGWRDNLELVKISDRGVALLNQIMIPIQSPN
ncbi:MAG: hypothetical protein U0930_04695 [Pirellulales bacterium]